MDELINHAVAAIVTGGGGGTLMLLLIGIVGLLIERRRQLAELEAIEDKIDRLLARIVEGRAQTVEALRALESVLAEIKGRQGRK